MAKARPTRSGRTPGSDRTSDSPPATASEDILSLWSLPAGEIDRKLATEDDTRLRILFGDDYEPLRQLARQASRSVRRSGGLVLFVPGILGSTLGTPGNFFTRDTIWFDPATGFLQCAPIADALRRR